MIPKIKIFVCGVGYIFPYSYYIYGVGSRRELVIIGDTLRKNLERVKYPLYNCRVYTLQGKDNWVLLNID